MTNLRFLVLIYKLFLKMEKKLEMPLNYAKLNKNILINSFV